MENFASNLEEIIEETGIKLVIVTSLGAMLGKLKGTIVDLVVKYKKKMVPKYSLPDAISFSSVLK